MNAENKVRLDKWLWAARFFKTRSLAKEAVEGGKVQYNDQRSKPGRNVDVGAILTIRQGWLDKIVVVLDLSGQRKKAALAAALYEETPESIRKRELALLERKQMGGQLTPLRRPNKRDRRRIHQFKNKYADQDNNRKDKNDDT